MSKMIKKGGKTAKGIKKNVIKNNIKHEDYKNTLINNEQMHHKIKTIRSQRHQLGSYEINKKCRSAVLMTSATSMIMEQAVMPMDTRKENKLMKKYFFKISASILLEQDIDPFYFPKYRPPYFWTRYRSFLLLQNIGLHTPGTRYDLLK